MQSGARDVEKEDLFLPSETHPVPASSFCQQASTRQKLTCSCQSEQGCWRHSRKNIRQLTSGSGSTEVEFPHRSYRHTQKAGRAATKLTVASALLAVHTSAKSSQPLICISAALWRALTLLYGGRHNGGAGGSGQDSVL